MIGDSYTAHYGVTQGYAEIIKDTLGSCLTIVGINGCGFDRRDDTNFYSEINKLTGTYDIVIIQSASNDAINNFAPATDFGNLPEDVSNTIKLARQKFGAKKVKVMPLGYTRLVGCRDAYKKVYQLYRQGCKMSDAIYIEGIENYCDLTNMVDFIHPNETGHEYIAEMVGSNLDKDYMFLNRPSKVEGNTAGTGTYSIIYDGNSIQVSFNITSGINLSGDNYGNTPTILADNIPVQNFFLEKPLYGYGFFKGTSFLGEYGLPCKVALARKDQDTMYILTNTWTFVQDERALAINAIDRFDITFPRPD